MKMPNYPSLDFAGFAETNKINLEAHRLLSLDGTMYSLASVHNISFCSSANRQKETTTFKWTLFRKKKRKRRRRQHRTNVSAIIQFFVGPNIYAKTNNWVHKIQYKMNECFSLHFINITPLCAASIDDDFIMLNIDCCCIVNPNECRTYPPPNWFTYTRTALDLIVVSVFFFFFNFCFVTLQLYTLNWITAEWKFYK